MPAKAEAYSTVFYTGLFCRELGSRHAGEFALATAFTLDVIFMSLGGRRVSHIIGKANPTGESCFICLIAFDWNARLVGMLFRKSMPCISIWHFLRSER